MCLSNIQDALAVNKRGAGRGGGGIGTPRCAQPLPDPTTGKAFLKSNYSDENDSAIPSLAEFGMFRGIREAFGCRS